jgi:hypothetical protein
MTVYAPGSMQTAINNAGSLSNAPSKDKVLMDLARAGLIGLTTSASAPTGSESAAIKLTIFLHADSTGATEGTAYYWNGTAWTVIAAANAHAAMFGAGVTASTDINANSFKVTNLATPTASGDATNKGYVDGLINGVVWKAEVLAATVAALATVTYANGTAGVGATLTASAVGTLTIDGYLTALGDRLLIKDQAAGLQNGIYTVTTAGAAAVAFVLTRAVDFDAPAEVNGGTTFVTSGSTNADTQWTQNAIVATVGTTAMSFVKIGPSSGTSFAQLTAV